MHIKKTLAPLALLLSMAASAANANQVTFDFSGTITDDPFGLLTNDFTFSGSYTFDSNAVDQLPNDPQTGVYQSAGPGFGIQTTIGGVSYAVDGNISIAVANNFSGPVDQYTPLTQSADGSLTLELFLQDSTATAFSSDALPVNNQTLNLSAFNDAELRVFGDNAQFTGTIDSLTCVSCGNSATPVPLPASGTLLMGALAAFALVACRRNSLI